MTDLRTGLLALRELGPEAVFAYLRYRIQLRSGVTRRRTPSLPWESIALNDLVGTGFPDQEGMIGAARADRVEPKFFFDPRLPGLPWDDGSTPEGLIEEADEIRTGRFRLFGGPPIELGTDPNWHAFPPPLADQPAFNRDPHWTEIPLEHPGRDVRLVWELSRFGWLFTLARAFRWGGDREYARVAWRLIESWREANPPYRGVHWTSGQEAALRILALAFAEKAFLPAWRDKPARLEMVLRLVHAHAQRVAATLDYARAQGNNHLLSEGAGLYTAGLLYPELRSSAAWLGRGRRALVDGFTRQVFDDGGYVQHSANYQRLALALGTWCCGLARLTDDRLFEEIRPRLRLLAGALARMAGPTDGRIPLFGPNDSSVVLRLAGGAPTDVRPEVEAAARMAAGESWYGDGPWQEAARWLGLLQARPAKPPTPKALPDAGQFFLQGDQTRGVLRCVTFQGRPGHSDQLHLDLWWRDAPLAFDPGSYLYNGPAPWEGGMSSADVHNTPVVNRRDPMRRAGRFLWVDRAQGRITARWADEVVEALVAEHDGYRKLGVRVRRTVGVFEGRAWLVVDEAKGAGQARLTVGWNLPDWRWEIAAGAITVESEEGPLAFEWEGAGARAALARAGEWVGGDRISGSPQRLGWWSPGYGQLAPCLRLVLEVSDRLPLRIRTRIGAAGSWPDSLRRVLGGIGAFPSIY